MFCKQRRPGVYKKRYSTGRASAARRNFTRENRKIKKVHQPDERAGGLFLLSKTTDDLSGHLAFDVFDSFANGGQLFGIFVRNFGVEAFFEGHHEFHEVEAVSTEVFDEFGFGSDLIFGNTKLGDDDFFDFFSNSRQKSRIS